MFSTGLTGLTNCRVVRPDQNVSLDESLYNVDGGIIYQFDPVVNQDMSHSLEPFEGTDSLTVSVPSSGRPSRRLNYA